MRIWHVFGVVVMILLLGCSTKIPSSQELEIQTHIPKQFANQTEQAKQITTDEKSQKTPIERFYALIDDKDLHALLDIALERNTDVLIMVSRIQQAKSQVRIDTASLFPTISANINTNYTDRNTLSQSTTINTGTNAISANLSASWELDLFGKLNALRKSSKKDYEQAQANLQDTQISLLAEVGTLYFTLRDNAYNIKLAKQTLENLKQIDFISNQEYQKGIIDLNTYKTNKQTFINQQNTLETLLYTYEQNKNSLLVLLDINADELESKVKFLDSASDTLPKVANFNPNMIPSEVLLERPDVKSSIFALHSQLYKTTNANAARLPTISLSGSIGQILYSTTSVNSLVFQIANSIATPILNRVSLRETYKIQKELSKEAFYTLQSTINTALGEIENALFDKDSKQRQVKNNKILFDLSKETYQADKIRAKLGVIDTSEFLTNENTHLSLQTQYFTSRVNDLIAVVTLFKAFGGALYMDLDLDAKSNDKIKSSEQIEYIELNLDSADSTNPKNKEKK